MASRLVSGIIDAQAQFGDAGVVLTGGGMGARSQQATVADPGQAAIDWSLVDFYWGDERFVAANDPDRNEKQAYDAMLSQLPIDPARVHAMPATGGPWGDDPEAAALAHATDLAAIAAGQGDVSLPGVPRFDILMLGWGPTHTSRRCSPSMGDHDHRPHGGAGAELAEAAADAPVVHVPGDPVRPRGVARGVGAEKAEAFAEALRPGADPNRYPAAGAIGRERTLALIDADAAAALPPSCCAAPDPVRQSVRIVAQVFQRLVQDGLGIGVRTPFLHVGQVGLVWLDLRRGRRVGLIATGGPAATGAVPAFRDGSALQETRVLSWPLAHQNEISTRGADSPRSASPMGPARPGYLGSPVHLPPA